MIKLLFSIEPFPICNSFNTKLNAPPLEVAVLFVNVQLAILIVMISVIMLEVFGSIYNAPPEPLFIKFEKLEESIVIEVQSKK